MVPFNIGRDSLAYIGTGISGGSFASAVSLANEIAQLIAAVVAIVSGLASLVYFWRNRKKK